MKRATACVAGRKPRAYEARRRVERDTADRGDQVVLVDHSRGQPRLPQLSAPQKVEVW
jgi:hypothetical protein